MGHITSVCLYSFDYSGRGSLPSGLLSGDVYLLTCQRYFLLGKLLNEKHQD